MSKFKVRGDLRKKLKKELTELKSLTSSLWRTHSVSGGKTLELHDLLKRIDVLNEQLSEGS